MVRSVMRWIVVAVGVTCLTGCQSGTGPASQPQRHTADAPHAEPTPPAVAPSTPAPPDPAPAVETQPASSPAAPATPDEPPQAPVPKTPPYLTVLERFDGGKSASLTSVTSGRNAIDIQTANVKRFRITRKELPLTGERSLAVRIDGRAFEWTRNHAEVEFELTPNGAWQVATTRP